MLEDLLLDHGEAALHEGSVSSSVPRHAFILNLKNRIRSEKMVYTYVSYAPYVQCTHDYLHNCQLNDIRGRNISNHGFY